VSQHVDAARAAHPIVRFWHEGSLDERPHCCNEGGRLGHRESLTALPSLCSRKVAKTLLVVKRLAGHGRPISSRPENSSRQAPTRGAGRPQGERTGRSSGKPNCFRSARLCGHVHRRHCELVRHEQGDTVLHLQVETEILRALLGTGRRLLPPGRQRRSHPLGERALTARVPASSAVPLPGKLPASHHPTGRNR
jgi:hypothetical protein